MHKLNDTYWVWSITVAEGDQRDWLIGQLSEAGIEGFVEEGEELKASALQNDIDTILVEAILGEAGVGFERIAVQQQNWNAAWEASFEPVQVGEFAAVRAHFHAPIPGVQHDLVITPKMSFGTGHHATTWLCLQAIQSIDMLGKEVIDFGTGTGVLAILAEKCGASKVVATDNDEWCIYNATENLELNGCTRIELKLADDLLGLEKADVLIANINRHILLANMAAMAQLVQSNGVCLVSGLLDEDEEIIVQSAEKQGLAYVETRRRNGWICIIFQQGGC